jgi:hypothetical protein
MSWRKWWTRLAEIPALVLAGLFIILELLRATNVWVAPINPIDQIGLLVAFLVVSFFGLRQGIEEIAESLKKSVPSDRIIAVSGRDEIDKVAARLLKESSLLETDGEICLVTFYSPVISQLDSSGKKMSYGKLILGPLSQRIRDGWAVRRLILVMSKNDLDRAIDQFVPPFVDIKANSYEVRIIPQLKALPPNPLLLIGRERALIGLYGTGIGSSMRGAIVMYGSGSNEIVRNHFETLWERPDAFRLLPRDAVKIDQSVYMRCCRELEENTST